MSHYCIELCRKFGKPSVHQLTWTHSCNSAESLRKALNSDADLIEADVMIGGYEPEVLPVPTVRVKESSSSNKSSSSNALIMCHPPMRSSNLTLEMFLRTICAYNRRVDGGLASRQISELDDEALLEGVEIPDARAIEREGLLNGGQGRDDEFAEFADFIGLFCY